MIAAVLLAAGGSTRMGCPKQLLPFGRGTLLEAALRPLVAAPAIARVQVVLGCRAGEVAARVATGGKVTLVRNSRWELGMASSIRCGVRTLPARLEAVLLALGDQPHVPRAVVERVIAAWRAARPRPLIVIPTFEGRRGHPVLFAGRLRRQLERLPGTDGARGLVRRLAEHVLEVPTRQAGILSDVDTPEEYRALRAAPRARAVATARR
jgi:molybdenum cofactor cytidylyltransferase